MGRRIDAGTILIALLVSGFVLRVFIAGILLPLSGFRIDIGDFTVWAQRLADVGPGGFYESGYFSDYPPGYLYVLWLLGSIGAALEPLVGLDITAGLVKVPAILADVGVAALLFALCKRFAAALGVDAPNGPRLGLVAATVYLFNPGTIFNAAVWGQIDAVGALVLLATVYLLARGWTEAAAASAVLALLVKFQFAFLVPIVAIVGLKRHLFGRSSAPSLDGAREPLRVVTSLAAGIVTLVVLIVPFGMTLWAPGRDPNASLVGKFFEAASTYTGLSVNAFNLWRLPFTPGGPLGGLGDTLHWGDDTVVLFTLGELGVTAQLIGTVLFVAVAVFALWLVARRDDALGILLAALVLAIAFFALPTRVHERYLFPALALAAPLVLRRLGWAVAYAVLSLLFFANVYWTYTADWSFAGPSVLNPGLGGEPMPRDPFLAATLFSDLGIFALSAMSAVVLGWVAWRALRVGSAPAEQSELLPTSAHDGPAAEMARPVAAADPPPPAAGDRAPLLDRLPFADRLGWLRRDLGDPYLNEPTRRLDRLDLALVIGFVLFALVFRLWRLDVPRGMHFDEVYHARSATEWLANWQHGWQRDVYEWTHPMLAKYLIAAGIVVADPNQVERVESIDQPAPALAVAPARSAAGHPRSVVFSAGGDDQITARDAASGDEIASWSAGGPVSTIVYDEDAVRLLVGLATSGTILTYDLETFLSSEGERAPPAEAPAIDSGLEAVTQIELAPDATTMLVRGPQQLAALERVSGAPLATVDRQVAGLAYVPPSGDRPALAAVTDRQRNAVALLDAATLQERTDADGNVIGVVEVEPTLVGPLIAGEDERVFALTGPIEANDEHPAEAGGLAAIDAGAGELIDVAPLPGAGRLIGQQPVANLVYVAGTGDAGQPVVWTIEPHGEGRRDTSVGFATFDTTPLPGEAIALAFDATQHSQADDAANLLLSTAGASGPQLVTVDAGSNAFAWRLAGVVFGALLVGLIYLLAATMFARRRVAVLAAAFVAVDGMSFVMSRISMNDIFVTVFIVGAYLLFWQTWSGRWARSAWWVLPLVGVLIGLAAATKWVGFYALAGLWVLVLARSDLGRLVLVAALAFLAVVAGFGAPWPFTFLAFVALALALLAVYLRPIRLDAGDLSGLSGSVAVLSGLGIAFGLAYSSVEGRQPSGAVELLFSIVARGAQAGWPIWIMLAVGGVLLVARAVRSLTDPASDRRWFLPGELGGLSWAWVGAALLIVPLTVYGLSYVPYLALGHSFAIPETGPGYHWSLDELHSQMFGYHFGLVAGHDSASPWWSWPLDLKPTWFYNGTYDENRIAVIYNGGNPLLFWAGVPAIVVCALLAWRRRSLALALLVGAFAFQYLPWVRIERATFMYHYLTAVMFAMVAVAYVVDEMLRSWRWRELAIAYLAAVAVAGILIFPLGFALPMPDWYINAARSLPPWNFYFQFPDPPSGDRGDLFAADALKLVLGLAATAGAVAFALAGRDWLDRRDRTDDDGLGQPATEAG